MYLASIISITTSDGQDKRANILFPELWAILWKILLTWIYHIKHEGTPPCIG